jgi:cysteinyl-tRNA synthetase
MFHWAMKEFNTIAPSIEPTATGHIVEQIVMIEKIIADGYAYVSNGSVYFDVDKYNTDFSKQDLPYGILSGRVLDDQLDTTRDLDGQDEKRNKSDFALWKNAPPEHIMRWHSPWGEGFPGWHIECSAMSTKYLGDQFDIHGGGMDLQFPHHECEIAQSAVVNNKMAARYWIHNNMITINGRKMGKSYNNVIKLSELFSGNNPILEQAYTPMTIRFFILQTHYRSTLDFGNEALQASEKGLRRLWEAHEVLQKMKASELTFNDQNVDAELDTKLLSLLEDFEVFMNDDFSTAKVLANMFEIVPVINSIKDKHISPSALSRTTFDLMQMKMKLFVEDIFGLKSEQQGDNGKLDGVLKVLIELRKQSKAKKDYATSDVIRKQLLELGIALKDEKDGNISYSFV